MVHYLNKKHTHYDIACKIENNASEILQEKFLIRLSLLTFLRDDIPLSNDVSAQCEGRSHKVSTWLSNDCHATFWWEMLFKRLIHNISNLKTKQSKH